MACVFCVNRLNPKKLLNSKWTSISPSQKEKHFLVVEVETDDDGAVIDCVIEAVMTKRTQSINWQTLKNASDWQQGWK